MRFPLTTCAYGMLVDWTLGLAAAPARPALLPFHARAWGRDRFDHHHVDTAQAAAVAGQDLKRQPGRSELAGVPFHPIPVCCLLSPSAS